MLPCKQVPWPMVDRSSYLSGWQPHHCRMPSSLQVNACNSVHADERLQIVPAK